MLNYLITLLQGGEHISLQAGVSNSREVVRVGPLEWELLLSLPWRWQQILNLISARANFTFVPLKDKGRDINLESP